jgi:4-amino-4-deoxy-L-arabinose transferase-like glycosyltransferase
VPNYPVTSPRLSTVSLGLLLLFAALLLCCTAWQRGAEYDEGYTMFVISGTPRPDWPPGTFRAAEVRGFAEGHATLARIAEELRYTDVHPPLYFWTAALWRALIGPSLFALRLLSVLYGLAALALVGVVARLAGLPPLPAMLLTLGCYGFSYTSVVARGFALAQALTLAGVLLLMLAEGQRRAAVALALAGGVLLGLATFSNYLAGFVGGVALLWLLLRCWRRPLLWLAGGIGFASVLPADLWFFLAQRNSRLGQFPPFHLLGSLQRLAQYAAGNVFGGLPLYVDGFARTALGGALALLLVTLVALITWRWRGIGTPPARWLLGLAAAAPPVGLLLLGLAFDNTPIELRYLAFAIPFFALLAAGALATLPARIGPKLLGVVLAVQAAALAGLMLMPQTMQPQAATTQAAASLAGPDGIVLIPHGNDGVGVVEAVVQSAPDWLRLQVVPTGATPEQIRGLADRAPVAVLALLGLDADSRATLPAMTAAFANQPCWRPTSADAQTMAFAGVIACEPAAAR